MQTDLLRSASAEAVAEYLHVLAVRQWQQRRCSFSDDHLQLESKRQGCSFGTATLGTGNRLVYRPFHRCTIKYTRSKKA